MNGTLEILREIGVTKELLRKFGVDELTVEGVTGQTGWDEIKTILDNDSVRFMEFVTEVESRLGVISDEMVATNRPLEDLYHPLAA